MAADPPALDPSALVLLAAVAREGGVRAGAAHLRLPRSTVSRRLAELERTIGAPLVVRTSRRFRVTDLGRALVDHAERIEELLRASEQLVRRSSTEPAGVLRVSVAPLLGEALLPRMLAEYLRRYPRVRVELSLATEYVDLRRANIDLALRGGPAPDADDLYVVRLGTSVTGCYAHPSYLAARGTPRRPADLAAHDCIVVGNESTTTWSFRRGAASAVVEITGRVRVNDYRIATATAAAGAGIVRLARFHAADRVAAGELVPVLEGDWPRVPVLAIHTSVSPAPTKIRAFIELAREAAARVLDP
ncbi:MAG TPA: LysR substrate-binding domain-containing protein [Kofleriaceae bacterium]|nr:LysR substrate-binding domain-containing protein [Kofleriaceae bacterium]